MARSKVLITQTLLSEIDMKLKITNITTENFSGEHDVIEVNFRIGLDEMYTAYLDSDLTVDRDNLEIGDHDADELVDLLHEALSEKTEEINKLISESVFGSNDFKESEQLFGTWLNSWGVFKFVGSDGECGVAVCHANDDVLRIDRKAKTFQSEDEYLAWSDEMKADDYYGDASIVRRAIEDIEGEN